MEYATVVVVVPAEDADDFVEDLSDGSQEIFFAGSLPGVSSDAFTAGASPTDWPNADETDRAQQIAHAREHNARFGVDQPVLLVYGDPHEGFRFIGPVIPNDPELDRFVDSELRATEWWYVPLHTLEQAREDKDLS